MSLRRSDLGFYLWITWGQVGKPGAAPSLRKILRIFIAEKKTNG